MPRRLRQRPTTSSGNTGDFGFYFAFSVEALGHTYFELAVVENSRFAVGMRSVRACML